MEGIYREQVVEPRFKIAKIDAGPWQGFWVSEDALVESGGVLYALPSAGVPWSLVLLLVIAGLALWAFILKVIADYVVARIKRRRYEQFMHSGKLWPEKGEEWD